MIIGVDYHPSFQQIAFFVEETGEYGERQLNHGEGEAERFYRDLKRQGIRVRVGMEATGYSRWFERLLAELGYEVWIGDPAEIKAKRVRKTKTDPEDARLLLKLLPEDRFPRIWLPSPENRDLRQLLWHRHRLVQMRTRIMNQLQALAMNENKCWKGKASISFLGQPAPTRVVGALGPDESRYRRVNCCCRERSREATRSITVDDASGSRRTHRTGLCADHRNARAVCLRQADQQLRGTDSE
jgi:Transposase